MQHHDSTIFRSVGGGSLMGYHLVNEILNYAPRDLTPKEMVAALAWAANANDQSRLTWDSVEDPMFLRQIRVGRARLYELLDALVKKGVLVLDSAGHRHGCAKYRFVNLASLQCPEGPDTEASAKCPEDPDTERGSSVRDSRTSSVRGARTLKHDQCPEDPDISVRESRTPTNQDQSSTTTNQDPNPLSRAAAAEAVVGKPPTRESDARDEPSERNPDAEDVSRAFAKARAEVGVPASGSEKVMVRFAAVELIKAGQSAEYLVRVAEWMATVHPNWIDLARARTAPGAPGLIPGQRVTAGYETWRDPNPSTYGPPKHVGWQNPTDPGAYDGTF